jgi:hypothetical protein
MSEELTQEELVAMVQRVFHPTGKDRNLAILVDLPTAETPDEENWQLRRSMAEVWKGLLQKERTSLGLDTGLFAYENVRSNNAALPCQAWPCPNGSLPKSGEAAQDMPFVSFDEIFERNSIILAPTQFSATAPLKLLAKAYGFRAATMPGFSPAMIPALRIDYDDVNHRVNKLKDLLDQASSARLLFRVDGVTEYDLNLDLRYRESHASGGLLREPGTAGNLPSGEAFIVPYEGEKSGVKSQSRGYLPVQFGNQVVIYKIENNCATSVTGDAQVAEVETRKLSSEPAYGNLAELGLGVLDYFGIKPCGSVLLDEKLGLHIAFGRSDHFGGQVGPDQFSKPESVVHIDRVFLPTLQPRIQVSRVGLLDYSGGETLLMKDSKYTVDFGSV